VTNASSERDVVIFAGSGCTAAVHKLIAALKLDRFAHHPKGCAVVFIGPHEHHSNILPWRECSGVEVVNIRESAVTGLLDCEHLKAQLEAYQDRPLLMGSFSAASNVTGALSEVNRITAMLKGAGALSFWDYASAGPCVRVDMNPVVSGDEDADGGSTTNPTLLRKDAIFLAPHKFAGGPGTPGILVAKRSLWANPVPSGGGGGTVFYVTGEVFMYICIYV
jgi:selenocysteine lyase/cysteine desulfurase